MKRLAITLLALALPAAHADVRLPNVFSDHGILQRDQADRIWGWAAPGEPVKVTFHNQQAATTADAHGHWRLTLKPEPAGGPYDLIVEGTNKIKLTDIVVGDIYLATGQSNIGYSFAGLTDSHMPNAKEVLAASADVNLRLLRVPKIVGTKPEEDQPAKWEQSSPTNTALFSLLGYLVGRKMQDLLKIPIGVMQSSYGGTPVESWVSTEALTANPALAPSLAKWNSQLDAESGIATPKAGADGEAVEDNKNIAATAKHPNPQQWRGGSLYDAMLAPLTGYNCKAVIWYQGESSADPDRAPVYGTVLRTLIEDWRTRWQRPDLPFIIVQLASYGAPPRQAWGTVRDEQRRATLAEPHTALTVLYDTGMQKNPHAPEKQEAASRIVLDLLGLVYGQKVEYNGPLFEKATPSGHALDVTFTHAAGLAPKAPPVKGFEVAGPDGKFAPATAVIHGSTITLTSPEVPAPTTVRYAWANFTDANLYNAAGLPAPAFTSANPK